jgi:hypothetical protein
VNSARLRRPKSTYSLSYVEYRPNTMQQYYEKLVTLREVKHVKDRETKNFTMVDIPSIQITIEILN